MDNIRITKETKPTVHPSRPQTNPTFITKHRWILQSKNLCSHYQKNVKLDAFNQEITFETMMVQNEELSAQNWVMKMKEAANDDNPYNKWKNETLTMIHYNAAGKEMVRREFFGLKVVGHKCFFDYADSTEATDTVYVKYDKMIVSGNCEKDVIQKAKWPADKKTKVEEINEVLKENTEGKDSELIASLDPDLLDAYKTAGYGQESMALAWAESEQKKRDKKKTQEVKKPLNLCRKKRQP